MTLVRMDVVVDSNTLVGIVKHSEREDGLTSRVRHRLLRVVVDRDQALVDEWKRTCNAELVQQIVVQWKDAGGFVMVEPDRIPGHVLKRLQAFGFRNQPVDKLILRIAIRTTDRVAVSNDNDFWHGTKSKGQRAGDPEARIARLLESDLGVQVMTPSQLMDRVPLLAAEAKTRRR